MTPDVGHEAPQRQHPGQILYVSWGGSGRSASLRAAFREAADAGGPLIYLAVLDQSTFGDIDEKMALVVVDELEWLLDAQINLTRAQLGIEDLPVRVVVRRGDVVEEIAAEVAILGGAKILLGAPVPVAGHVSLDAFVEAVAKRSGQETAIAFPQ